MPTTGPAVRRSDDDGPLAATFSPGLLRRFLIEPLCPLGAKLLLPSQIMRASQFDQFAAPDDQVVMLGDSITEGGLWQEWFPGAPLRNRGIGGETTADILRRLDTAIGRPAAVFLLIGTNDITAGSSLRAITDDVRTLLTEVERRAPGTPVLVQSVMPRTPRFRDDIRLLNRAYQVLVDQAGDHVEYLDLWPALADEQGDLIKAFTQDGIHLNGLGYAAWVDVLRPHLERLLPRTGHVSS